MGNGKEIVLDSGCSKTLGHHILVPVGKVLPGIATTIYSVHHDAALYRVAALTQNLRECQCHNSPNFADM